ncbi:hypothetical protein LY76DRAFT_252262 [Colletotrichum caudatum]|nr:hypothetical protein LY76DRAFT_252262 [Colletotrichum caudatum]
MFREEEPRRCPNSRNQERSVDVKVAWPGTGGCGARRPMTATPPCDRDGPNSIHAMISELAGAQGILSHETVSCVSFPGSHAVGVEWPSHSWCDIETRRTSIDNGFSLVSRQHLSCLFLLLLSRAESSCSGGGEPLPSSRATRRLGQIVELGTPRIPSIVQTHYFAVHLV